MKKQEIEARGPDVEEAIASGLSKLGVSRNRVEVEVVDEGRRGLLGIGGREVIVRLRVLSDPKPIVEPVAPPAVEPVETAEPKQETTAVASPPPAAVVEPAAEIVEAPSVKASSSDETDAAVTLVGELLDMMQVKVTIDSHFRRFDR